MASRRFYQFRYSAEAEIVELYMAVSIGAAGAPTLVANQNKAISAIARNSAGNYTVTLSDNYKRIMLAEYSPLSPTAPAAPVMSVITDSSASGSLVLQFTNSTGVATDPASGETLLLCLTLKNSTI